MHPLVQQTLDAIESAVAGMEPPQMKSHPEGKWCTAEVLEHLLITYSSTARGLEKVLQAGSPAGARPSVKQRVFQFVVLDVGHFPVGRKAPAFTVPKGVAPEMVLGDVRKELAAMDKAISECEQRFGGAKIADHPVLGPLTAVEWRKFHLIHARHHMKQVAALRNATA